VQPGSLLEIEYEVGIVVGTNRERATDDARKVHLTSPNLVMSQASFGPVLAFQNGPRKLVASSSSFRVAGHQHEVGSLACCLRGYGLLCHRGHYDAWIRTKRS
jgi:hypothetical protein